MKISETIWIAANEKLLCYVEDNTNAFSCDAIASVSGGSDQTFTFVRELGVNSYSRSQFDEFKEGTKRQGARYLWLMFAYLVAKDEGL